MQKPTKIEMWCDRNLYPIAYVCMGLVIGMFLAQVIPHVK